MKVSTYFKGHYRAGEYGYYNRERGTIDVFYDSQKWVYERPKYNTLREFKAALISAFEQDDRSGESFRIAGSYPQYTLTRG